MKYRGFTFIEIIFAVLIITILSAIAFPSFRSAHNTLELNSVSRNMQATFAFLHQRAIVEEQPMLLTIDNDNKAYFAKPSESQSIKRYPFPKDVSIETQEPVITFYPDGSIDPVTVHIKRSGAKTLTLTTQGVFGGIKTAAQ